jgi:hypothetical protein
MENMTKEQILNEWKKESQAANDCICEILSSYMDFVLYCMVPHPKQDNVERLIEIHKLATQLHDMWFPFYQDCLKVKKEEAP